MEIKKLKKFYKNRKVFITGHTGFKGIWLYLILKFLGANVLGYSLPLKKNDNYIFYKNIKNKINSRFGNILNFNYLKKSINSFSPEIVFHFAAQSLVIESQKNPKKTLETNIIGTNNVIKICQTQNKIKSLVIATSDKCYTNNNKIKSFSETSKLGGEEPYSFSKAICENLIHLYLNNYRSDIKFGLSSVRAGNVIGGGDFSNYRIIPDIIKNYKKKKIRLRNPNHVRPWQDIMDVCYAYLLIPVFHNKNKMKYSGSYNVGPLRKKSINVYNLTKKLTKEFKIDYKIHIKKENYIESKYLFLNSNKIKNKLKWKPSINISKSIKNIAIWYNDYFKKKNLLKISNIQIKNYFYYQ